MAAIFRRELTLLFRGWRAWTYLALTLLVGGVLCFLQNVYYLNPAYQYTIPLVSSAYMLTLPLLAMDAFPGDRRRGTDRLIASLPLSPFRVVAGKFLALMVPVALASALLVAFPVSLVPYGAIPLASTLGSIAMHLMLGVMLTAAALFMSSLSRGQFAGFVTSALLIAAMFLAPYAVGWLKNAQSLTGMALVVVAVCVLALAWLVCRNWTAAVTLALVVEVGVLATRLIGRESLAIAALRKIAGWFGAFDRLTSSAYGLFDLTSVFYYLSAAVLFLGLSYLAAGQRAGWKGAKA